MNKIHLRFPHQLFPLEDDAASILLIEEHLFFRQYAFHKQKLAYHRATMKQCAEAWQKAGVGVHYIGSTEEASDVRKLGSWLKEQGVSHIVVHDVADDWLERRCKQMARDAGLELEWRDSPVFLNTSEDLKTYFTADRTSYFQTDFYIEQRKTRGILLEGNGKPRGGKWSFDADNRKKYPKDRTPPSVMELAQSDAWKEAIEYIDAHFANNPGKLSDLPMYPTNRQEAKDWLEDFLQHRFEDFGAYEDAIVKHEDVLNHSVLTPMLNVGLLTPKEVIDAALEHADENVIPLNSLEGFVRQIIGWREFIRGVYLAEGREERTTNIWGFERKIPVSFYDGTTGIEPVDHTIKKLLDTGYSHHIERLMILGNFMLLCEFDPDEVYRWFMELYIDAYDWVMVPNVYGMSQFADGGLFATKPYISGSNYIRKMSDYASGDWQQTWDGLFWRFMHVHRDYLKKNPRLNMLIATFDKMPSEKRGAHLGNAEAFLKRL